MKRRNDRVDQLPGERRELLGRVLEIELEIKAMAREAGVAISLTHPTLAAMGRRGGIKGGAARAASMTPERRSEIARNAAEKRWATYERKER